MTRPQSQSQLRRGLSFETETARTAVTVSIPSCSLDLTTRLKSPQRLALAASTTSSLRGTGAGV